MRKTTLRYLFVPVLAASACTLDSKSLTEGDGGGDTQADTGSISGTTTSAGVTSTTGGAASDGGDGPKLDIGPGATSSVDTGSVDTGSVDTGISEGGPKLDIGSFPAECVNPMPTIVVETGTTPDGMFDPVDASFAVDVCTGAPAVRLLASSWVEFVLVLPDGDPPDTLEGSHAAMVTDSAGSVPATGTFELLDPVELSTNTEPDPSRRLHARVSVSGNGWDLSVVVDAPYCGESTCSCPCE